ncbi:hypothetical protein [Persephonella sp.]
MDFWKIYRQSKKLFLFERTEGKVSFNMQSIPADSYRFINSILKVNIDLVDIITEGWYRVSPKYEIYPVVLSGMWSEKYFMFEDKENIAIVYTPESLKQLRKEIRNTPVEKLIMLDYVEVSGLLSPDSGEYDIKGDLNDEEIRLINSIIHAFDDLTVLITDMLLFTSGLPWDKTEGWFISGKGHTLFSVYGKWVLMDTSKFEEYIKNGG